MNSSKRSCMNEKILNIAAALFIVLLAIGWSWSIAAARVDEAGEVADLRLGGATVTPESRPATTPVTRSVTAALTDPQATGTAYLTDAALSAIAPLRGESGKLKAILKPAGGGEGIKAPDTYGIWKLVTTVGNAIKPLTTPTDFNVITLRPASEKRRGRLGLYYIGNWPNKGKTARVDYTPPSGFIEVTRENAGTYVSDHFRLRDFLPHDQQDVWPKYLVLNMKLVDKLELVLADLRSRGINTRGVRVMSGFRTPQYNSGVGETRGRASLSRHMYGDASDIYIDNDGNGSMDDLNRDGRVNIADAEYIRSAAVRVEQAHPSLIGGIGVYRANSAHGPFTHIDTRGYPARW